MNEAKLPKAWDEMMEKLIYMPALVKTIERIHDTNWSMDSHKHDHYEVVYVKKGNAFFQIEEAEVNLSPHSVIIIKPQKTHKLIVKSDSCELIVLYFVFKNKKIEGAGILGRRRRFQSGARDKA